MYCNWTVSFYYYQKETQMENISGFVIENIKRQK